MKNDDFGVGDNEDLLDDLDEVFGDEDDLLDDLWNDGDEDEDEDDLPY